MYCRVLIGCRRTGSELEIYGLIANVTLRSDEIYLRDQVFTIVRPAALVILGIPIVLRATSCRLCSVQA
jgi:hypothetical protein